VRAEAVQAHNEHTVEYLFDMPLLSDFLEESLRCSAIPAWNLESGGCGETFSCGRMLTQLGHRSCSSLGVAALAFSISAAGKRAISRPKVARATRSGSIAGSRWTLS
jgi:Protein of unknown function (DUF3775)